MDILYEDNHILAVNKQASEIVQGDKTGDEPMIEALKQYLKAKYNKPGNVFLGLVHRIDRPVSGVVLFARTSKALTRLNELIKERRIVKTYLAIVKEKPPKESDTLVHYLVRNTRQNKSYAHQSEIAGSQRAELAYRLIGRTDRYFLLEIDLRTGRHHQIRCQLAAIGCPVRGDLKYGFARSNPGGGISLHAWQVRFAHPVRQEEIEISAPLPQDALWDAFAPQLGLPENPQT